jgi:hypothetical protein
MATTEVSSDIPPLSEAQKARFAELVEEYHDLIDLELDKTITPEQKKRLEEFTAELDEIEECMPQTIYMRRQMEAFQPKLDEIDAFLAYIESLPKKPSS